MTISISRSDLPSAETLKIEFKSDLKRLSDNELVEALVCMANSEGGELWLGVEDNGTPTGLHNNHKDLNGLVGLIAARTSPSIEVIVDEVMVDLIRVCRIQIPKAVQSVISTTSGTYLRRRLKQDGMPECVPMLPHERQSHAVSIGLADSSAQAVAGASLTDFDPLERERLRQAIQNYGGDRVLLELDDEQLDAALGFTTRNTSGERVPTLTGMLVIGRENVIREKLPTHELAFQVLEREEIRFNEFRRFPLLKALEWLEVNFRPYNPEKEVQIGLFRVPVPKVDMGAFREALANALVHRDYHCLGAVYVRLDDQGLTISNPGGLVEGVTLHNLLSTEPRPRNPLLADVMKRIGIVERSGRGVDKIYRGMLRFGRPFPDYSHTDNNNVILKLATVEADAVFLQLVVEQERQQGNTTLPINSLIVLSELRDQKRLNVEELARCIQQNITQAKRTLEQLVEAGLVQAHGRTRGRTYTLSAELYRAKGDKVAYTRQAGFTSLQNEQMVLNYVDHHGRIQRKDVIELCHLNKDQAARLLKRLKENGHLVQHQERSAAYYTLNKEKQF
tara:strand:- start:25369 stop:27057 length:1689 start_codon:yes stop_codon:yes gene_type:complete